MSELFKESNILLENQNISLRIYLHDHWDSKVLARLVFSEQKTFVYECSLDIVEEKKTKSYEFLHYCDDNNNLRKHILNLLPLVQLEKKDEALFEAIFPEKRFSGEKEYFAKAYSFILKKTDNINNALRETEDRLSKIEEKINSSNHLESDKLQEIMKFIDDQKQTNNRLNEKLEDVLKQNIMLQKENEELIKSMKEAATNHVQKSESFEIARVEILDKFEQFKAEVKPVLELNEQIKNEQKKMQILSDKIYVEKKITSIEEVRKIKNDITVKNFITLKEYNYITEIYFNEKHLNIKKRTLSLIYSATSHGFRTENFIKLATMVDNIILIVTLDDGERYAIYSEQGFVRDSDIRNSKKMGMFNLTKEQCVLRNEKDITSHVQHYSQHDFVYIYFYSTISNKSFYITFINDCNTAVSNSFTYNYLYFDTINKSSFRYSQIELYQLVD